MGRSDWAGLARESGVEPAQEVVWAMVKVRTVGIQAGVEGVPHAPPPHRHPAQEHSEGHTQLRSLYYQVGVGIPSTHLCQPSSGNSTLLPEGDQLPA